MDSHSKNATGEEPVSVETGVRGHRGAWEGEEWGQDTNNEGKREVLRVKDQDEERQSDHRGRGYQS